MIDQALTIFNVVASIAVVVLSSAYWTVAAKNEHLNIGITSAAVISVVTAVLQYVLDFRGTAFAHKSAANNYAMMNRKLELAETKEISEAALNQIMEHIDALSQESPVVSASIWGMQTHLNKIVDEREKSTYGQA